MSRTTPNSVRYVITRSDLSFSMGCQRLAVPLLAVSSVASAIPFVPPAHEFADRLLASCGIMSFLLMLGLSFLLIRYWIVQSHLPREIRFERGVIKFNENGTCQEISASECHFWRGSPTAELTGVFVRDSDCWLLAGPLGTYCLPDSVTESPVTASFFLGCGMMPRLPTRITSVLLWCANGLLLGVAVSVAIGSIWSQFDARPQVMLATTVYGMVTGTLLGIINSTSNVALYQNRMSVQIGSMFLFELALAVAIHRVLQLTVWEFIGNVVVAWFATYLVLLRVRSKGSSQRQVTVATE